MPVRRKGLSFNQSPNNYDIYKFIYYGYSSSMRIKVHCEKNHIVSKNDLLATLVINADGNQEKLLFPFPGKIVELFEIPEAKEGSITNINILQLQRCQHWPNPVPCEKGTEVCMECGETIWHYYQKETVDFTIRDIEKRMEISLFDLQQQIHSNFQWTVAKNEHITKNTEIAKAFDQSLLIDINGKIRFLGSIGELKLENRLPNDRFLDKVFLSVSRVICRHQKVIDLTCQFCLQHLEQAPLVYLFQQNQSKNVATGRALDILEEQYIGRLMKERKGIMILDLDNTILNAVSQIFIKQELENDPAIRQEMLRLPIEYPAAKLDINNSFQMTGVLVKMRPFFQEFLKTAVECFDIYIYTKGTRPYANSVCDVIRQRYSTILAGTTNFQKDKMITRDEDPLLQKKSMNYIVPTRFEPVIILDDRRQIWESSYCIFVKQYFYFKMHPDGKKWYIDEKTKKDCYLAFASRTLRQIHNEYFARIGEINSEVRGNSPCIISKIYHNMKKGMFRGVKAKFILDGCAKQNIQQHGLFRRAKRLGIENVKQKQIPELVIRSIKLDINRVKELKHLSQELKIPVVCELWVSACYQYNYPFLQNIFIPDDPLEGQIKIDTEIYHEFLYQTANKLL